ncbi:MAG: DUF4097 family beta strand repeat protein [Bdellovibrionaceae bacterium]|nr:DUF4097 family beta strand repeat protein [Pseudobdellovibrionaceae bacterium]
MSDRFYKFYVSVLFVTVALFGLSGFFSWMAGDSKDQLARQIFGQFSDAAQKDFTAIEENVELQERFQEISIRSPSGDVSISPSPDDKTRIHFSGKTPRHLKRSPYGYRVQDGVLHIKVEHESEGQQLHFTLNGEEITLGARSPEVNIDLQVPNELFKSLQAQSVSGDFNVQVPKGSSWQVDFKSISGHLENHVPASPSPTGRIQIQTVSGDAEISESP